MSEKVTSKIQPLSQAAQDKLNMLDANRVEQAKQTLTNAAQLEKERGLRNASALLSDDVVDTLPGSVANTALSFVEGLAREVTKVARLPGNTAATIGQLKLTDEQVQAYRQYKAFEKAKQYVDKERQFLNESVLRGTLSQEDAQERFNYLDQKLLEAPDISEEQRSLLFSVDDSGSANAWSYDDDPFMSSALSSVDDNPISAFDRIEGVVSAIQSSAEIDKLFMSETGIDELVNDKAKDELAGDLSKTWNPYSEELGGAFDALMDGDLTKGISEGVVPLANVIWEGAGDLVNNPAGLFNYVAENIPQLLVSSVKTGALLSNGAYAANALSDGTREFIENEGRLPNEAETKEMVGFAVSLMAAEMVGDISVLRAFRPQSKANSDAITNILNKAGIENRTLDELTDGDLKKIDKVMNPSLTRKIAGRVGNVAQATVNEGLTEAYQSTIEETEVKGKDWREMEGETAFIGGMIGAGSGGGIVAAPQAAGALKDIRTSLNQKKVEKITGADEARETQLDESIVDGNVNSFLTGNDGDQNKNETNDSTKKVEPIDKFELRKRFDSISARISSLLDDDSPEAWESAENLKVQVQEVVETAKVFNEQAEALEAKAKKLPKGKERKKLEQESAELNERSQQLNEAATDAIAKYKHRKKRVLEKDMNTVTAEGISSERYQISMQRIIREVAKGSNGLLTSEQIEVLATNEAVQQEDKEALSYAVEQQKNIEDVQTEVLDPNSDSANLSLAQHEARIEEAIASGNAGRVRRYVNALKLFAANHESKRKIVNNAFEPFRRARLEAEGETVAPLTPAEQKRAKAASKEANRILGSKSKPVKGNRIHAKSGRLVGFINLEADEINAAVARVEAKLKKQEQAKPPEDGPKIESTASEPVAKQTSETATPTSNQEAGKVSTENFSNTQETQESSSTRGIESVNDLPPVEAYDDVASIDSAEDFQNSNLEEIADVEVNQSSKVTAEPVVDESITEETGSAELQVFESEETTTEEVALVETSPFAERMDLNNDPAPLTVDYFGVNLIQTYYKQATTGLLSQLSSASEIMASLPLVKQLLGQETLSTFEMEVLSDYVQFHGDFSKVIGQIYLPINERYKNKDFIQFLDQDGELPEDVESAITAAVYQWMSEKASSTLFNTKKDVASVLGLESEADLDYETYIKYQNAGTMRTALAQELGKAIRKNMGLTLKDRDNTSVDMDAKLEGSLGNVAIALMEEAGLVERSFKINKKEAENENEAVVWVRPPHTVDENNNIVIGPKLKARTERNRKSGGVIGRLFDPKSATAEPALSPVDSTPKNFKGTLKKVSNAIQNALKKHQQNAHYISEDTLNVWEFLTDDEQRNALEVLTEEEIEQKQITKRNGLMGSLRTFEQDNANLRRWTSKLREGVGLGAAFYLQHVPWKTQRIGLKHSLINPQASKLQRGLVVMDAWRQRVKLDSDRQVNAFMFGMAQAVGLDIDKQQFETSLEQVKAELKKPVFADAIEAIRLILKEQDSIDGTGELVAEAIKAGGHGTSTLNGLVNYARYLNAKEAGDASFVSDMSVEVDGKTNGPVITMIQFGAEKSERFIEAMQRGGIFQGNVESFGAVMESAFEDNYENFAKAIQIKYERLRGNAKGNALTSFEAIERFITIDRKFAKPIFMTKFYGQGIKSMLGELKEQILEQVYDVLEQAAYATDPIVRESLIADVNALIASSGTQIPYDVSNQTLLNDTLGFDIEQSIEKVIKFTVGAAIQDAMKEEFGVIDTRIKAFNDLMQAMNELYLAAYQARYEEKITEKLWEFYAQNDYQPGDAKYVEPGSDIRKSAFGRQMLSNPTWDLTHREIQELNDELAEIMPGIKTLLSGDDATQRLDLTKSQKLADERNNYFVSSKFAKKIKGSKFRKTAARTRQIAKKIGPGGAVKSVHSLDATVALGALANFPVLNVHDGFYTGVLSAMMMGRGLNGFFMKTMQGISLPKEGVNAAKTAMEAAATLFEGNQLVEGKGMALASVLNQVQETLLEAEAEKVEFLESVGSTHQYVIEGGGFFAGESLSSVETTAMPEPVVEKVLAGSSKVTPALAALPQGVGLKVGDVIKALRKDVSQPMHKALLDLISELKDDALREVSVRTYSESWIKGLEPNDRRKEAAASAQGFFDPETNTVYLRDTSMEHSGLNPETVIHELIHSIVDQYLAQANQNGLDSLPAHAQVAIKSLQRTFDAAKAEMEKKPESVQASLAPMFENLREFIAWGLTNENAQNFLTEIKGKTSQRDHLFARFIKAVSRLLMPNSFDAGKNTAIMQLAENFAVIASEVSAQKKSKIAYLEARDGDISLQRLPEESYSFSELFSALLQEGDNPRLSTLAQRINGMFNLDMGERMKEIRERLQSVEDFTIQHMIDGTRPFISNMALAFGLSPAQAMVAEQFEALLASGFGISVKQRAAIKRLHAAAAKNTDWRIFADPALLEIDPDLSQHPSAKAKAQQQWNRIFEPTEEIHGQYFDREASHRAVGTTTSTYLDEFMVLALVHDGLFDALDGVVPIHFKSTKSLEAQSLGKQLQRLWIHILQTVQKHLDRTRRDRGNANQQLDALLQDFAELSQRKRTRLARIAIQSRSLMESGDDIVRSGFTKVGKTLASTENQWTKSVGQTMQATTSDEKLEQLNDSFRKFVNSRMSKRWDFIGSIMSDMMGATASTRGLMRLLRQSNREVEQSRAKVKQGVKDVILDSFGRWLSRDEEIALTRLLIKTDAQALLDNYSLQEITRLVTDAEYRAEQIKLLETRLLQDENGSTYINQARNLGFYLVTGRAGRNGLVKNATGIARMFGTAKKKRTKEVADLIPVIDMLATLEAMDHTRMDDFRSTVGNLLKEENQRGNESGAEFLLKWHRQFNQESKDLLFGGDAALTQKGWTSEIVNPHTEVKIVAAGSPEAKTLELQGFVPARKVIRAKDDPEYLTDMVIYIAKDGGPVRFQTGVFSYRDNHRKGTDFSESQFQAMTQEERDNLTLQDRQIVQSNRDALIKQHERMIELLGKNPVDGLEGYHMIPVFNPDGDIVDLRYEMSENAREDLLEKRYELGEVLGSMAGATVDKTNSSEINALVVDHLEAMWQESNSISDFVRISDDSSDPKIREIWKMLPDETRQGLKGRFGHENGGVLYVRRDLMDLTFGYRKFDIGELWNNPETAGAARQLFLTVAGYVLDPVSIKRVEKVIAYNPNSRSKLRARSIQRAIEEVVKEAKDILVVKNFFTLLGNVLSNWALLSLSGMSVVNGARLMSEGWTEVMKYQENEKAVFKLEQQLAMVTMTAAKQRELKSKILRLKDDMAKSPVAPLVQVGLFQTIVEDIDTTEDPYSHKSQLFKKLDGMTSNVPQGVKDALNVATLGHDTSAYKFLNQATQISDFAARYAQYVHYTTRTKNPMSHEQAIDEIIRNFVNYDVPQNRTLQAMNDLGLIMFTKYYMRIQRPLWRLLWDNPTRALGLHLFDEMLGLSTPLDSSMLNQNPLSRFTNPLALAVETPDEIVTINGLLHATGVK